MRLLPGYVQTGGLGFPLAQGLTVTRHTAWLSFRPCYFYPSLLQGDLLLCHLPEVCLLNSPLTAKPKPKPCGANWVALEQQSVGLNHRWKTHTLKVFFKNCFLPLGHADVPGSLENRGKCLIAW